MISSSESRGMHMHLSGPLATKSLRDLSVCQKGQKEQGDWSPWDQRGRKKKTLLEFPRKPGEETGSEESGLGNNKVSFDH